MCVCMYVCHQLYSKTILLRCPRDVHCISVSKCFVSLLRWISCWASAHSLVNVSHGTLQIMGKQVDHDSGDLISFRNEPQGGFSEKLAQRPSEDRVNLTHLTYIKATGRSQEQLIIDEMCSIILVCMTSNNVCNTLVLRKSSRRIEMLTRECPDSQHCT